MLSSRLQTRLFALRSNKLFELFVVSIILLSALVIGAKTYSMPPGLISFIGFLDIGITVFFLIEITIRFTGAICRCAGCPSTVTASSQILFLTSLEISLIPTGAFETKTSS